ncbi:hypothetical protein NDU88_005778 [Pleurodeles waltl]|uniref:Uncharacterized protein n=1 Tax=Pleurodeles waltl TaxID=8319 RepID=A0AAV7WW74_PLEWA|nr:hypothetical protein NDU88_005778 [Pleurodeles waltl]
MGPGCVAREAPGSALFRLGSPGAGAPHCPLMRMEGERTPDEDGPLRNLGLRTTTTTTAERKRSNITQGLNSA